jgi:hypothetical protein
LAHENYLPKREKLGVGNCFFGEKDDEAVSSKSVERCK